jgi:hypothetical protein
MIDMLRSLATFSVLFLGICSTAFGQNDSIRNEILSYPAPKSETINRGRNMIIDLLVANDQNKVRKVLNYLIEEEENQYYLAFYPGEKWLLYYWTEQYDKLIESILYHDTIDWQSNRSLILPNEDLLIQKLRQIVRSEESVIKSQIKLTDLNEMDKAFLELHFNYLMETLNEEKDQDYLNTSANQFLASYPNSGYEQFVRRNIRYVYKISQWGAAYELFTGGGIFSGGLQRNFKNVYSFGIAGEIAYKDLTGYFRISIGHSKTKDSISFSTGTWRGGENAELLIFESSIGYTTFENNRFKVSPFIGFSSAGIAPSETDKEKFPEYEDVGLKYTMAYTLGVNMDIKFKTAQRWIGFGPNESYRFIRLRYSYIMPQFDRKYNGFSGDLHCITIGFGAFARAMNRDF